MAINDTQILTPINSLTTLTGIQKTAMQKVVSAVSHKVLTENVSLLETYVNLDPFTFSVKAFKAYYYEFTLYLDLNVNTLTLDLFFAGQTVIPFTSTYGKAVVLTETGVSSIVAPSTVASGAGYSFTIEEDQASIIKASGAFVPGKDTTMAVKAATTLVSGINGGLILPGSSFMVHEINKQTGAVF